MDKEQYISIRNRMLKKNAKNLILIPSIIAIAFFLLALLAGKADLSAVANFFIIGCSVDLIVLVLGAIKMIELIIRRKVLVQYYFDLKEYNDKIKK